MLMTRWSARAAGLVVLSVLLPACKDRPLTLTRFENPLLDGGGLPELDATPDLGRDVPPPRDLWLPDRAPDGTPCTPQNGGVEICNDVDDDCNGTVDDVDPAKLNDPLQCGSCNIVCEARQNTSIKCEPQGNQHVCAYTCMPGTVDQDNSTVNGCECVLTGGAAHDTNGTIPETICDGRDNDCDGMIDEGFDLASDDHCGSCNKKCSIAFADAECRAGGVCTFLNCKTGYFDRNNSLADGCETQCLVTNNGVEACDGLDNDCDGQIDNGAVPPGSFQCKALGVCAGTQPACVDLDPDPGKVVKAWVCNYPATYEAVEGTAFPCDGLDNDCDGAADEGYSVGTQCFAGIGACRQAGQLQCDPNDRTTTRCSAVAGTPQQETCNGVDDDCDGKFDELDSLAATESNDIVVNIGGRNITMFAHEASRPTASRTSAGTDSTGRPCSLPGRLPWANISAADAAAACARVGAGWRLCTRDEWIEACTGNDAANASTLFPYGSSYNANRCNGADYLLNKNMTPATIPTGDARVDNNNICLRGYSGGQFFDMSGNVREWVGNASLTPPYEMRGGAYNIASFAGDAPGLKCGANIPAPTSPVVLPSVGFRCCRGPQLPAN